MALSRQNSITCAVQTNECRNDYRKRGKLKELPRRALRKLLTQLRAFINRRLQDLPDDAELTSDPGEIDKDMSIRKGAETSEINHAKEVAKRNTSQTKVDPFSWTVQVTHYSDTGGNFDARAKAVFDSYSNMNFVTEAWLMKSGIPYKKHLYPEGERIVGKTLRNENIPAMGLINLDYAKENGATSYSTTNGELIDIKDRFRSSEFFILKTPEDGIEHFEFLVGKPDMIKFDMYTANDNVGAAYRAPKDTAPSKKDVAASNDDRKVHQQHSADLQQQHKEEQARKREDEKKRKDAKKKEEANKLNGKPTP